MQVFTTVLAGMIDEIRIAVPVWFPESKFNVGLLISGA